MYIAGGQEVPKPDPAAGLYVTDSFGADVLVDIPADSIAFQVGRALAIQSGGVLQATPHYVRAPAAAAVAPRAGSSNVAVQQRGGLQKLQGVSRNTLAVFMQPRLDDKLVAPLGAAALRHVLRDAALGRWSDGMTFGSFAKTELHGG
jgi:isopenicillin N synthase-like dioxygenase